MIKNKLQKKETISNKLTKNKDFLFRTKVHKTPEQAVYYDKISKYDPTLPKSFDDASSDHKEFVKKWLIENT